MFSRYITLQVNLADRISMSTNLFTKCKANCRDFYFIQCIISGNEYMFSQSPAPCVPIGKFYSNRFSIIERVYVRERENVYSHNPGIGRLKGHPTKSRRTHKLFK